MMILQSRLRLPARLSRWMLNRAHIILVAGFHVRQLGQQGAAVLRAEGRTGQHFRRPILRLGQPLRQREDVLAQSNCF